MWMLSKLHWFSSNGLRSLIRFLPSMHIFRAYRSNTRISSKKDINNQYQKFLVCVSDVVTKYQWIDESCLPACESWGIFSLLLIIFRMWLKYFYFIKSHFSNEFHQESIQYVGIQSKYSQNTSTVLINLAGKT